MAGFVYSRFNSGNNLYITIIMVLYPGIFGSSFESALKVMDAHVDLIITAY
jgi:hypothetical protein